MAVHSSDTFVRDSPLNIGQPMMAPGMMAPGMAPRPMMAPGMVPMGGAPMMMAGGKHGKVRVPWYTVPRGIPWRPPSGDSATVLSEACVPGRKDEGIQGRQDGQDGQVQGLQGRQDGQVQDGLQGLQGRQVQVLNGRAVCTLGPSEVRALSRHTALFNFSLCSSDPRSEVNAF